MTCAKFVPTIFYKISGKTNSKERFEPEARTISNLSHPYICALHDVGHQHGIDFPVMEFMEGDTLAQRLSKGPLTTELVFRYGIHHSTRVPSLNYGALQARLRHY